MKSLLLLFLLPLSLAAAPLNQSETSALLEKIAAARAGRTVQAEFVEKKTLPLWKDPVIESGVIAFEPPDRFLRKTRNIMLCDGKTLWMSYPEFQQVEKYPVSSHGPGQIFSALGQAMRFEHLEEIFRVSASSLADGFRIELTPKSVLLRRAIQTLTLELDSSLRLRSSTLTGRNGNIVETTYSNEKLLPPGTIDFTFTPPASATVTAPLGER